MGPARKLSLLALVYLIAIFIGVGLSFFGYSPSLPIPSASRKTEEPKENYIPSGVNPVRSPTSQRRAPIPFNGITSKGVKGLHISGWVAGSDEWFMDIVGLVKETQLNSLVIDCKDETGYVNWNSRVGLARKSGATSQRRIRDIQSIMRICRLYSIYSITRIVVFRDPVIAKFRPPMAVHDTTGGLWRTDKGYPYLDPYNHRVWEYNVALAKEAAQKGFQEIQFDYVRFPTDGDITRCIYPGQDERVPDEVITGFLRFARKELSPLNVTLAIDVFGQTGMGKGDMKIGQRIEKMAQFVDIISPMLYPSHYRKGVYGVKDPEAHPYTMVDRSLADILNKLKGSECRVRPWLQDFSLSHHYGKEEIRAQIKACYDNGIQGWMLWDPRCRYTSASLNSN